MSGVERFDVDTGQFTNTHFAGDAGVALQITGGHGVSDNPNNGSFYSSVHILSTAEDIAPNEYVALDIVDATHTGSPLYQSCNPGIYKDGNNCIFFDLGVLDFGAGNTFNGLITIISGGSKVPLGSGWGPLTLTAPFRFAAMLDGHDFVGFVRQGGVWTEVDRANVSAFIDLTSASALTGYKPGFSHWRPPGSETIAVVDNLQWGPKSDILTPPVFYPFFPPLNLTLDNLEYNEVAFHWDESEEQI